MMGNYKVLKTAEAKEMRYSMYDLINSVKENELIWRRDNPHFHNRELRHMAWNQVARTVYQGFDSCTSRDQENIKATLLRRWKNARDSLLRSFRLKDGVKDSSKTRYIYEKELSFILTSRNEVNKSGTSMSLRNLRKRRTTEVQDSAPPPIQFKEEQVYSPSSSEILEEESTWESDAAKFEVVSCPVVPIIKESTSSGSDDSKSVEADQAENETLTTTTVNTDIMSYQIIEHGCAPSARPQPIVSIPINTDREPNLTNNIRSNVQINAALVSFADPRNSITTQTEEGSFISDTDTDTDQDFLNSMKPYMKRMSFDRKLDFKIEMLKLVKNYT